jgi:hypothetical protein
MTEQAGGTPLRPPCHVGIVTCSLDRAMGDLGHRFGVEWGKPRTVANEYVTSAGRSHWTIRVAHSKGPIAIELIEGSAGSVWETTMLTQLHHYAFWSSDLAADVAELERKDYRVGLTIAGRGDEPVGFAYLARPGSPRLELIERHTT